MRLDKLKGVLKRIKAALVEPAAPVSCKVCGRLLTSPKSIAAGMGSCCAKKGRRDPNTFDMFEAGTPGSELQ